MGDFRGVGQMGKAGFDDANTRDLQALLDLVAELGRDHLLVGSQGLLILLVRVIGEMAGQLADGRLALDGHEVLVVVHVEGGPGRIDDVPDDDRGDLDGVAPGVVDLDLLAVQVEDAQGELLLDHERVGPVEAGLAGAAGVLADEGEDLGFVGMDDIKARAEKPGQKSEDDAGGDGRGDSLLSVLADEEGESTGEEDDDDDDDRPAVDLKGVLFLDVDHECSSDIKVIS